MKPCRSASDDGCYPLDDDKLHIADDDATRLASMEVLAGDERQRPRLFLFPAEENHHILLRKRHQAGIGRTLRVPGEAVPRVQAGQGQPAGEAFVALIWVLTEVDELAIAKDRRRGTRVDSDREAGLAHVGGDSHDSEAMTCSRQRKITARHRHSWP